MWKACTSAKFNICRKFPHSFNLFPSSLGTLEGPSLKPALQATITAVDMDILFNMIIFVLCAALSACHLLPTCVVIDVMSVEAVKCHSRCRLQLQSLLPPLVLSALLILFCTAPMAPLETRKKKCMKKGAFYVETVQLSSSSRAYCPPAPTPTPNSIWTYV